MAFKSIFEIFKASLITDPIFGSGDTSPIIGNVDSDGRAEAGDTLWLDHQTLVIGRGFRTNPKGIEQI